MSFEPIIGLEVHVQLNTNTKMFCSCASNYLDVEPNTYVCNICLGLPGSLPSVNYEAVVSAIKLGLSLNCRISNLTKFDRKNYVYPDLMKGYQISQLDFPIAIEGNMKVKNIENKVTDIRINRVHMEEDVAKLIHDEISGEVLVDLNRSGMPLLEVVTEPDFRSATEAENYLTNLQSIVRYLGIGNANMEEGSFRCDANVSIREKGSNVLNEKVEIKNMNRIKAVARAIEYEIERQTSEFKAGNRIIQETRGWDDIKSESIPQRSKEDAHDYRYFPDPDLLPLKLSDSQISEIRSDMPELPDQLVERLISEYGITKYDANVIAEEKEYVYYYENSAKNRDGKLVVNWMTSELFGLLKKNNVQFNQNPISPNYLNELVELIENKTISGKIAKDVFEIMFATSKSPKMIVKEKGLEQVTDDGAIEVFVDQVINENKDKVKEYLSGKNKLFGFFVGQVMKVSQGKANPGLVNKILKSKLK